MKYPKGYMDKSLFKKIIEEISHHSKVSIILHFRGESLLHQEFVSFLRLARKKIKGRILLATNGSLLSKKIAKALIENRIDFISISIDAIDPKVYQIIRRNSDYEKVYTNVMNLINLKRKYHAAGLEIQVSMVETKFNKKDKEKFITFWLSKVNRVRIYPQHSLEGKFGKIERSLHRHLLDKRKPCVNPLTDMGIYWDGRVVLCSHDWNNTDYIGNIRKKTIREIWNSPKYNEIRLLHWKRDFSHLPSCKHCDQWMAKYLPYRVLGELYSRKKKIIEKEH